MDDFEKMMEAEGVKPAKDDFKELVDFIVDNRNDPWAIEDAIAAYSDKLQTKNYKRGYEDAIELMEKIMRKNFKEAFEKSAAQCSGCFPLCMMQIFTENHRRKGGVIPPHRRTQTNLERNDYFDR